MTKMAKAKKDGAVLPVIAVIVAALAAATVALPKAAKDAGGTAARQEAAEPVQGVLGGLFASDIKIVESDVGKTASFYDYDADGVTVEIFAVRASDGSARIAFNTCQVCQGSPFAYFVQRGDYFVCQNCGNAFGRDDVGVVHGGCNPVPVTDAEYRLEEDRIVIPEGLLAQRKDAFSNWKKQQAAH